MELPKQFGNNGISYFLLAGLMLLAVSLACAQQVPDPAEPSTSESVLLPGSILHDGVEREYLLRLPAGYQVTEDYPLVLALHGGGGSAERMCSLEAGIQTLADQEGFLVVCPQGVEDHWNDGRQIDIYTTHREQVDDVGFLVELVDQLISEYPIDSERVYLTGFSNGGMMSFRLACEQTARFAAIAPSIANMPADLDCRPSTPLPVMILNGTEDPLMPFEGGQVGTRRNPLGEVLSTEATAEFWAAHNGCDTTPQVETLPVEDAEDPTRLKVHHYQGCQEGGQVVLYVVAGGGHTWPGGPSYAPELVIGPTSNQANSAVLMWEFFTGYGR